MYQDVLFVNTGITCHRRIGRYMEWSFNQWCLMILCSLFKFRTLAIHMGKPYNNTLGKDGHCDIVVTATAQLQSTKPELRFCEGSKPAHSMSNLHWWEYLATVLVGNKDEVLVLVSHSAKTTHNHS